MADNHVTLTTTERCVVQQLVEGRTVQEIGRYHGRTQDTVRWHVKNLHRKTGARREAELVLWAMQHKACCLDMI